MKSAQILFVVSSLVFTLSACVTTRSELNEKRAQGNDVSEENISRPSSSVKSEDLNTNDQPAVVENKSAEAPAQITNRPSPLIPVQPSSQYGMEEMRAELAKLSGKVEEMEQEKKNQQAAQTEEQNKLQTKIAELEKQLKEQDAMNNGPSVPEGKTPLQAAKDAYFANNYETSIQYLDVFLKKNVQGKDVEEATFFRAESNYKLKQYKKAIVDYSKFPEKFSKSNYNPKAMLKIAECFEALEMKEDAKAFYQDLFEKYPKTVEGKLAKKKMSGKSSKK